MDMAKVLSDEVYPIADTLLKAMDEGKSLEIVYNGESRIIEAHAVGTSSRGLPCVRAYQVIGGAKFDGDDSGWKMFTLVKITEIQMLTGVPSLGPRPGYRPNDVGMGTIFKEISDVPVPAT